MVESVSPLVTAPPRRRSSPVSLRGNVVHGEIGLALASGGPLGVTYEIGALNALAESLDGIDFNDLGVYVGVSAGSVLCHRLSVH